MGASPGAASRGGGRRRRGTPRYGAMAEINMTPFIDVMLVLLIIFMVAAPLLTSGVTIDLPKTQAGAINADRKPIAVSIDSAGKVYVGDAQVPDADLPAKLKAAVDGGADDRVYVRASKDVSYGTVAGVMATITAAGFKKVALVTDPSGK
ncbi:MAG: protein TolR [Hyphomicrobiales bacterium]|nr:protein TolR [Hyphomicrobiales bacterium]